MLIKVLGFIFFIHMEDPKIQPQVAQTTAMKVLETHQGLCEQEELLEKGEESPSKSSVSSPRKASSIKAKTEAMMRLASQRGVSRVGEQERELGRHEKFQAILKGPNINLHELRELSWSGIPTSVRPITWKILAGYLPPNKDRWDTIYRKKREEYWSYVQQYYDSRLEEIHADTYRQIHIDIPRMAPLIPLFQQDLVQDTFERILFIWAIRHPASGYVQGINDLVTPIFVVFLQEFLLPNDDIDNYDVRKLYHDALQQIEADSYWCLSHLLDGIQDNYTFAQPGIQNKVFQLKELIQRIDVSLHEHLCQHEIDYLQFSFRWMNNLLMREIPLRCTIRLWDTYLAEKDGFATFHLYVCAAFLIHWNADLLRERDFQGLMLLLQNLPTQAWTDKDIGMLLAEAFRLKYMFADAPNHLSGAR
ncbi:unnamed protein product [Darwinula stevensoni]|uniref:Rab-GAP TBC domain-containing protein n=1 Tax=Darwinula stevensoni TaxID=69355 RepID=A0A7R9FQR7_9CRUS|nr:unnamed protein product [Darwinula stevensoni]CAG0900293.1 unnamed protein product [Darwinula stevensoni]